MEVNDMTCFLWWVTGWHPKGRGLQLMTPLVLGDFRKKIKFLAQIESKFNCKIQVRVILGEPTQNSWGDSRNDVRVGSNLLSNWQIAMSNNKTFHTSYWMSMVNFTCWCLGLGTCSKENLCYEFFLEFWYMSLLWFFFKRLQIYSLYFVFVV